MSLKKKLALVFLGVSFLMSVSAVFSDLNKLVLKRQSFSSTAEEAKTINPESFLEIDNCPMKNKGDANCDGEIGINDLWVIKDEIVESKILKTSAPYEGWGADFNKDGKVNFSDLSIWKKTCFRGL